MNLRDGQTLIGEASETVESAWHMGSAVKQRTLAAPMVSLRRPVWLPENVWPFETLAIEVDGSKIAITDVGDGPVLLFVHTGLWSFIWRDVILRLSSNFRCVCFDAPGTGRSDRLPSGRINLERASRVLTAVIETLALRDITLIVHDLGGPSGIAGAARVPDRIRAICVVNAFAWKPAGIPFRGMLALLASSPMRELSAWTGLLMRLTSSAFGVGLHMDVSSRNAFYKGMGRQGVRAFHSYLRDARKCDALYEEIDRALTGSFHRLPLITIFGERNDPLGMQMRWKQLFPDSRQVVVSKGNHFPMCDDPDLVAASIRDLHRNRITPT